MKKTIFLSIMLILCFAVFPAQSNAGTAMIGLKGWYAWWDSAIGETFVDMTNEFLDEEYFPYDTGNPYGYGTPYTETTADIELGKGMLIGPLFSYQTNDKLWSFSLALMYFGSFSQEANGEIRDINSSDTINGKYEIDLNRREIDIAVARTINDNIKVFAGYKHQTSEQEFTLVSELGTMKGYDVDVTIKILTAGIGLVYPMSDKTFLGCQLGVLYVMPTVEFTNYLLHDTYPDEDYKFKENFDETIGFNGEVNLSYLAAPQVILQLGYRYQMMKFSKKFISGAGDSFSEWDTFQGITLTAVYMMET